MEMVHSEQEALLFCQNHFLEVKFNRQSGRIPAHVVLKFGFKTIIGKDLVEVVNRTVEMYKTIPIDHDKLPWWNEVQEFYLPRTHL